VIPDEEEIISRKLIQYSDQKGLQLILTTGERADPEGRDSGGDATGPRQGSSRDRGGHAGRRNEDHPHGHALPGGRGNSRPEPNYQPSGQPRAVRENLMVILPALKHALEKIQGDPADCGNLPRRQGGSRSTSSG